jgi:cytochrome c
MTRPINWLVLLVVAAFAGVVPSAAPQDASPERGSAVFEKCAACHALDDNPDSVRQLAGPSLKGVFGRKAASREDFRYSPAMTRSGVVWNAETIDAFIADPQAYIRGNRMSFAGITEKAERSDLIAYLAQAAKSTAP